MKLASLIVGLVLVANFAQAKDRYLVQFKSSQGFAAMKSYFANTESVAPSLQKTLDNVGAMVLKTKNVALLNSLKNHPEVLSVEPERFFPAPKPLNGWRPSKVTYFESSFKKKQPVVFAGIPDFKQGPSTPWGIMAVNAGAAWAQSGAGQNARVLVLDTGVDVNHPAIAPNFEKGRNFTENAQGQTEAGFEDGEGHGTHCSGTIAGAYNAETGFTGVAPKAKLLMGKVCAAEGCSTVAVVEGINWGIQEKVDVISMSLGGPAGSSAERTAVANAEKAGVVVVAASGNGADDPNYSPNKNDPKCGGGSMFGNSCGVSFPAAFPTVIAVGALNDQLAKTSFSQWGPELDVTAPGAAVVSSVPVGTGRESKVKITVNGTTQDVLSSAFSGTELVPTAVIKDLVSVPGVGKPEDFAQVVVTGKFALVKRGEIKFADKVKNAIDAGAVGVVIYNHSPGLMQGALSEDGTLIPYPVVMVEKTTGDALAAELARGSNVSASITLGPSDYASFDGTSMATPHVAGVVALIRSANKRLTPAQVRTLLSGTAKALAPNDTNQFGAGIVQADAAVRRAVGQ